ncbi:hypothetical protein KKH59_04490 [Patescibacteria group bacterium]|nr:hypothetical protein [Patescibacteria group bacterium]
MLELIALFILIASFLGMVVIVFRKIPVLVSLPAAFPVKDTLVIKFKKRIGEISPFKNFSYELFLQKILAKIRILALKIENLTLNWVQKLKESYQKKKTLKIDDYWQKIRKEVKRKEVKKVAKPK